MALKFHGCEPKNVLEYFSRINDENLIDVLFLHLNAGCLYEHSSDDDVHKDNDSETVLTADESITNFEIEISDDESKKRESNIPEEPVPTVSSLVADYGSDTDSGTIADFSLWHFFL